MTEREREREQIVMVSTLCCIGSTVGPVSSLALHFCLTLTHMLPVSLLPTAMTSTSLQPEGLVMSYTTSLCLNRLFTFCCFLFLVSVCSLDYVVTAPAVDYQSVESQRAAKASSTNMIQYPNEAAWLWPVETNLPISLGQALSTDLLINHISW